MEGGSMTALASSKRQFKCPICERTAERKSRTQVYCSAKCMRRANYGKPPAGALENGPRNPHSPHVLTPHKISNENNILQWPKTRSSLCFRDGIVGPPRVIHAAVIAGREWQEIVSSDGVKSYVSRVAKRALVGGD
jgi:hypothetical protein